MNWKEIVRNQINPSSSWPWMGPVTRAHVTAVARRMGLSEEKAWSILAKNNRQLTRLSETRSIFGSPLAGLLEKAG